MGIIILKDYDYVIEHRSGTRMKHVDALSRHPIMTISKSLVLPQIKNQQENDDEIKAITEIVKDKSYDNFHINGGLLYKFHEGRDLLVIPRAVETDVIRAIHERGHVSAKRTEEVIDKEYFLRDLKNKVERLLVAYRAY